MAVTRSKSKQKKQTTKPMAKKPSQMEFVKVLGKGSFGEVKLYKSFKENGSKCYNAVKIATHLLGYEALHREFKILSQLRESPRIIQCFGDSLLKGRNISGTRELKMLMEYAAEGTLDGFIRKYQSQNQTVPDSIIKDFTRMILQGLVDIHKLGYVHCDLKPENLLIFPRYHKFTWELSFDLKISDFGNSQKAATQSDSWSFDSPFLGTSIYMSPESVREGMVEKSLDLWSLGCIVLEMITGSSPWRWVNSDDLMARLWNGEAPEIPAWVPSDARQFVEKCFKLKPEERGSALELLEHCFLTGEDKKTEEMTAFAGGEKEPLQIKRRAKKPTDITKKPLKLRIRSNPTQFKKKLG